MREGNGLVLPAVQDQHGNGHGGGVMEKSTVPGEQDVCEGHDQAAGAAAARASYLLAGTVRLTVPVTTRRRPAPAEAPSSS